MNENHIYGNTGSKRQFGLFQEKKLLAVMTFAGQRKFKTGKSAEILRFCSKNFITITGGLSKLINAYTKIYRPDDIMTYVDIDWGKGLAFSKLGFVKKEIKENINFYCNRFTGERIPEKYFKDFQNIEMYEIIKNSGSIKFVLKTKK